MHERVKLKQKNDEQKKFSEKKNVVGEVRHGRTGILSYETR